MLTASMAVLVLVCHLFAWLAGGIEIGGAVLYHLPCKQYTQYSCKQYTQYSCKQYTQYSCKQYTQYSCMLLPHQSAENNYLASILLQQQQHC
jgi:hypothetical protein